MRKRLTRLLLGAILIAGLLGGILGAGLTLLEQNSNQPRSNQPNPSNRPVVDIASKASPAVISITSSPALDKKIAGSGFIFSSDGLILTSAHVVSDPSEKYLIVDEAKNVYPVLNIVRSPTDDIAILKIAGDNLPILKLGNSDSIKPGQEIIAVGSPFGILNNTITNGIISGVDREIVVNTQEGSPPAKLTGLVQIDAAINPGSSGGPLINLAGEVVGINIAGNQEAENIGFAVPINKAKQFLLELSNQQRMR